MRLLSSSLTSSSPFLRFLAAARSDSTASMASRPHHLRGGSGRYRGYCDQSAFGEGENVAGDSHLHLHQGSGRGLNSGFRQVKGGGGYVDSRSYNYNNVSSNCQFSPRPQFQQHRPSQFQQNRAQQFQQNRQPYVHQNHGFDGRPVYSSYNAPMSMNTPSGLMMCGSYRQPVYVNQQTEQPNQFRPRKSKPLDFREWEYVKPEPPCHWERFTILSYNILADYLANEHWRKLYFHIPRHMLSWEWRKNNLIYELRLWSPDIMCFQEVDRFEDLAMEFKCQGYEGIYKMRTGNPVDGCSIFWRTSKFKLLHEESIEFNKLGLRDNVAQICVLESVQRSPMENPSAPNTSTAGPNQVVVCNIHVLFNPKRGDIKLGQVRVLFDKANAVSKAWNNAPVVVCGDFNCTPKSPLYNYISEQKLDLSGLARDKVSGQASAEIQAPMFNRPNPEFQALINIETSTAHAILNSDAGKSDSHLNSPTQVNRADLQGLPQHVNADELNRTMTSEGEPSAVTSGTVDNLQDQPQHIKGDEPNGTSTLGGELSSGDADDVLNAVKKAPPLSSGSDTASLKSNKMETDIPYSELVDEISHSEPSSEGTRNAENAIPQLAEKTTNVTETGLPIPKSSASDAPSCFENIFEEPTRLFRESDDTGEDGETFLSELTGASLNAGCKQFETTDSVDEQQIHILCPESEPSSPERTGYNPSLWTRTEIETATGNGDCTSLEHPLQLSSTYSETEDLLGTRDDNGEPLITSYNRCFCGTVDYIWRSEGLRTVKVLSPMRKQAMQWTAGFPTKKWGSDHIALVAQLAFVQGSQKDQRD